MINLNEVETKINRLVETRGVAGFKYYEVCTEICNYIAQYVKQNWKDKPKLEFQIPFKITEGIDFIENLNINVTIMPYVNNRYGSGNCLVSVSDKLTKSLKIKEAEINIVGYTFMELLMPRTILQTLYHEINHLYDAYNDLLRNNSKYPDPLSAPRYYKDSKRNKAKNELNLLGLTEMQRKFIAEVIYRFFSHTEYNALIASVYGDLQGLKSKRSLYLRDIKNTVAYKVYGYIKDNYVTVIKGLNDDQLMWLISLFRAYEIPIHSRYNTVDGFRSAMIKTINQRLDNLWRKIGSVASLYYDKIEDDEKEKELKEIVDNGGWITVE